MEREREREKFSFVGVSGVIPKFFFSPLFSSKLLFVDLFKFSFSLNSGAGASPIVCFSTFFCSLQSWPALDWGQGCCQKHAAKWRHLHWRDPFHPQQPFWSLPGRKQHRVRPLILLQRNPVPVCLQSVLPQLVPLHLPVWPRKPNCGSRTCGLGKKGACPGHWC